MSSEWYKSVTEDAIIKYGKPEIENTDQGSQYTSEIFTGLLKERKIKISMDGKGRDPDNIYIERLWKSIKYEDIYLKIIKRRLITLRIKICLFSLLLLISGYEIHHRTKQKTVGSFS